MELLLVAGDGEEAVAVRRAELERHPTATAYRALLDTAHRADPGADTSAGVGLDVWAVAVLRERAAQKPAYAGELIDVLLATDRGDEAWQVGLDHRDVLPERQLHNLLDRRGGTHPGEVIDPYRQLIEAHVLNSSDKHRYARAIELLRPLHDAHQAAGDPHGFTAYLDDLRVRHKRRPTFLAKLDAATTGQPATTGGRSRRASRRG